MRIHSDEKCFICGQSATDIRTGCCANCTSPGLVPSERFLEAEKHVTELFERDTAKPLKKERTLVGDSRCPTCNVAFYDVGRTNFCGNCGQRLLWKEE